MKGRFLLTVFLGALGSCIVLADDGDKKENPKATKLFADARQARAMWTKFPGFTADVAVTINGKMQKGNVQVNEKGKVTISDLPEEMTGWTPNPISPSSLTEQKDGSARDSRNAEHWPQQKQQPQHRPTIG